MIAALAEWVRRKGIGGFVTKSGKARKATADEAVSMAWAIARSMQKRGIFNRGQGLRIFGRTEKEIPRFVREECAREVKKAAIGLGS